MAFSRFIWTILAFILAIAGTAVTFGIFLHRPGFPVSVSFFLVLLAMETVLLIWYLIRIRRDLLRLVLALKHEDPTLQFRKDRSDPYFSAIHKEFNGIIRDFRLVRLDREAEQQFFEATVNHIRFGLLAFENEGRVELANEAFRQLFGLEKITLLDELDRVSDGLSKWITELGDREETLKRLDFGGQVFHLIFQVSRFRLKDREITLLSVRDISREINRNELEAWQKLMRVLRHEILNSITPIRLLSGNLASLVREDRGRYSMPELSQEEIADLKTGLETIHRRASGLSGFLDAYSNLYRVPEPVKTFVPVMDLLKRVELLRREDPVREERAGREVNPVKQDQAGAAEVNPVKQDQAGAAEVKIEIRVEDPGLEIPMDERMIEQVLINLVKNATEALAQTAGPRITLSALHEEGHPIISVKDNGPGIPSDQLEHIFIPFYSTREEGSGIGLSFAQHVMRLHNGRIHVRSTKGKGSEFRLIFPPGT